MRWEALFADMEAQLDAAAAQDQVETVAGLTRAERATVGLADRLRAAEGTRLDLVLRSGLRVTGALADAALTWVLLVGDGREHLVPLAAVVQVAGLPHLAAPPAGATLRRLGLGHALRAVARDRAVVQVATGPVTTLGRVDAVGADHLDVAVVRPDSHRPTGEVRAVPLGAVDVVTATA